MQLELAIWFHDVILVSGERDNEARSAQLYLELSDGSQRESLRQLVWRLIMATLHDGDHLDDADSSYMVDIDLSSFGLPWDEFMHDSMNVRTESRHLCDADYQLKQTGFQRSLLARSHFYLSDFFFRASRNSSQGESSPLFRLFASRLRQLNYRSSNIKIALRLTRLQPYRCAPADANRARTRHQVP